MANLWVTTPHPFFNDCKPLQVMLKGGKEGLERIDEHLNGKGSW